MNKEYKTYLDYTSTEIAELVDKDKNGIYISNEKAKELLEALEELGERYVPKNFKIKHNIGYRKLNDKLKQVIGGNNE